MEGEVSWQKLVGVDDKVDDIQLSPVFHKNKWIVIRKSQNVKEPSSGQFADKRQSTTNSLEGCEISGQQVSSASAKRKVLNVDENIQSKSVKRKSLDSTPTSRKKSSKRKLIEHPLIEFTPPSVEQSYKRLKHLSCSSIDKETVKDKAVGNGIAENNSNESSHLQPAVSSDTTFNNLNQIKRKLLYSVPTEKNNSAESRAQPKNVTVNDLYKSIIMLEEADKLTPLKEAKSLKFKKLPQDFVSVSDLEHELHNQNNPVKADGTSKTFEEKNKDISGSSHANKSNLLNDSLCNFQFTEVEECYHPLVPNQVKNNEITGHRGNISTKHGESDAALNKGIFNSFDNVDNSRLKHGKKSNELSTLLAENTSVSKPKNSREILETQCSNQQENHGTKYHLNNQNVITFEKKHKKNSLLLNSSESKIWAGPSGLCKSDVDLINARSKFENDHQDSIDFSVFLTQANKINHKTLPLIDFNDNKSSSQADTFDCKSKIVDWQQSPCKVDTRFSEEISVKKLSSSNLDNLDHSLICINKNKNSFSSSTDIETENESEERKQNVEFLLKEVLDEKPVKFNSADISIDYSSTPLTLVQYSTANGSVVKASQVSLDRANELMKDILNEDCISLNKVKINDQKQKSADVTNLQFSTASGFIAQAAEEHLNQAETLLKDLGECFSTKAGKIIDYKSKLVPKVSSVGSKSNDDGESHSLRKDITVKNMSEESSNLNSEGSCYSKNDPVSVLKVGKQCFITFSTARGTTVETSCSSVDKVRTLFKEFLEGSSSTFPIEKLECESSGDLNNVENNCLVGVEKATLSLEGLHKKERASVMDNFEQNEFNFKNCTLDGIEREFKQENSSAKNNDSTSDVDDMKSEFSTSVHIPRGQHLELESIISLNISNNYTDLLKAAPNEDTLAEQSSINDLIQPSDSSSSTTKFTSRGEKSNESSSKNLLKSDPHDSFNIACELLSVNKLEIPSGSVSSHALLLTSDRNISIVTEKPNGDEVKRQLCFENSLEQSKNSFEFSTAAGGTAAVTEKSLEKVKTLTKDDRLFEESKEESYHFSSFGDEAILLIKEEKGLVKFNTSSENTSKQSRHFSLAQKSKDLSEKEMLSQNTSVFECLQFTPRDIKTLPEESLHSIKQSNQNSGQNSGEGDLRQETEKIIVKENLLVHKKTAPEHLVSRETEFGFISGRGNKMVVSESALQKVKRNFQELMSADYNGCESEFSPNLKNNENSQEIDSKNAVLLDKTCLNDKLLPSKSFLYNSNETSNSPKFLFSNANGKSVNVSEKSLQKVKSHFKDELDFGDDQVKIGSDKIELTIKQGFTFSSAKGRQINISEESIRKAKLQFKDDLAIPNSPLDKKYIYFKSDTASEKNALKCKVDQIKLSSEDGIISSESDSENLTKQPKKKGRLSLSSFKKYEGDHCREILVESKEIPKENHKSMRQHFSFTEGDGNKISTTDESFCKVKDNFSKTLQCMPSFSTALGKTITVSEVSLEKVRQQFLGEFDVEDLKAEDFHYSESQEMQISSVLTAHSSKMNTHDTSVQKIKQNEFEDSQVFKVNDILSKSVRKDQTLFPDVINALEHSKNNLENDKVNSNNDFDEEEVKNADSIKSSQQKQGSSYSATLQETINVSEESLEKFDHKFKEELFIETVGLFKSTQNIKGLSSGSGVKVNVSEGILQEVKEQFKDIHELQELSLGTVASKVPPQNKNFSLSNAQGGTTKVSEESLQKVKQQFKDELKELPLESVSPKVPSQNKNFSFSTALGGTVKVSEESLQKVKHQFKDELKELPLESVPSKVPSQNKNFSFSTALGGTVKVSEESLQIVKQQFKDELKELALESSTSKVPPQNKNFSFCTAQGGTIKVSQESLQKVKQQFKDELKELPLESVSPKVPSQNKKFSISTALDKTVKVSEESLQKVKQQFKDELEELPLESVPSKVLSQNKKFSISTALDKTVKVSEESLQKVKQQFKDELQSLELPLESAMSKLPSQNKNFSFSTAQGRTIKVSEESLQKVKQQFKDELQEMSFETVASKVPSQNKNFSFSTALGGTVKVSEESLQIVKQQFKDELKELALESSTSKVPPQNKNFSFCTAQGGTIKVSEESLQKVKQQFKDELKELPLESVSPKVPSQNKKFSISTALDKTVKVSEESLQKVKQQFKDELQSLELPLESAMSKLPSQNKNFSFSTAQGRTIKVSEESLQKVKQQFKDELQEMSFETVASKVPSQNKSFSFSTAQGGTVKVSEESLQIVKQQFKDELQDMSLECVASKVLSQNKNFSFSTAHGGTVKVSEESLQKVKQQFKDELEELPLESVPSKVPSQNKNFSFSTAHGGTVKVSEESLQKVKQQFKDELEELPLESVPSKVPSQNKKFSISTALDKTVKVSEESLQKVKQQFKDELQSLELPLESAMSKLPSQNKNFSFSTAQGRTIKVSEESLQKVKQQFKDELQEMSFEFVASKVPSQNKSFSFSTAQGGTVKVSEESLQIVKQQFKDELLDMSLECVASKVPSKNKNFSFSTAHGGTVKVSEESLQKVKQQFKDELNTGQLQEGSTNSTLPSHITQSCFFSTAQGRAVSVSEASLQKAKQQFLDELEIEKAVNVSTDQVRSHLVSNECIQRTKPELNSDMNPAKSILPVDLKSSYLQNVEQNKSKVFMHFTQSLGEPLLNAEMDRLEESIINRKTNKSLNKGKTNFKGPTALKKQPMVEVRSNLQQNSNVDTYDITQSIEGSLLDDELSRIEGNSRENYTKTFVKSDVKTFLPSKEKPKVFLEEPPELHSDWRSQDSFIIQEVADSAAALIQDSEGFSGKPFITSPTSLCNRNKMKPLNSWPLEFSNDDDILAAAETPKKEEYVDSNSIPIEFFNTSFHEKRKSDTDLQPINKKLKLSETQKDDPSDINEIIASRGIRREEQKTIIDSKKLKSSSISPGLYMSIRSNQALMNFMDSPLNNPQTLAEEELLEMGLLENVIKITSKNATEFQFTAENYFSQEDCFSKEGLINVGSCFNIVLTDDNKIGLEEISTSFLCHPNVDPSLVPQNWIKNHFRWIIWKLGSLEKCFPQGAPGRFLLPINVLHQLKYRYDREIDLAQRPALRRILECDSAASRRFIACIADVRKVKTDELESSTELEITDGWYSVWSTVDSAMEDLIRKNKINIGTKLIIHGAELVNCTDGCDPLELNETVRLKLHTNSVRRVKWCTKMGFTRYPGPFGISVDSIMPNGGIIGLTTGVVARVYPMLYMSRDSTGKSVVRNSHAENHFAAIREKERNSKSEELYEKILNEVQEKYKTKSTGKYDLKNIKQIKDPQVLWNIVSNESDPTEVHSMLSSDQLERLRKYHEEVTTKIRDEVNKLLKEKLDELVPLQKVVNLMKIRLVDPLTESSAIVTIWRPTEDVCSLISENKCIDFYALNSCGTREKVLQLANTKHSRYKESTLFTQTNKFQRKLTDISDLIYHESFPMFGELDIVGIVVYVKEPDKPWGVTNVFLSDIRNNFLMITFWTSLKTFGFEELLREGSIVAAVNLHRRQGCGSYVVPSTFANEVTYFSANPSQEYLSQEIAVIRSFLAEKELNIFLQSRRDTLQSLVKERSINVTPVRQREGGIGKRLELLKNYGTPSPLPKVPLVSSPDIHRSFRSPKINNTTPKTSRKNP